MNFYYLSEFNKEFLKLLKKYLTLEEDLNIHILTLVTRHIIINTYMSGN